MKIKSSYKLRTVAGENMVVNVGNDPDTFNGVIMLNDTGAFLWKLLEKGAESDEMIASLISEYKIDEATAAEAVNNFMESIKNANLCE